MATREFSALVLIFKRFAARLDAWSGDPIASLVCVAIRELWNLDLIGSCLC